ncbi:MAG: hypothetical protein ABSE73_07660 [Planctomycetota bacterium]
MQRRDLLLLSLAAMLAAAYPADAAGDTADLRLRIAPNESLRYAWTVAATSESKGIEKGRPFTLNTEVSYTLTLLLRGLPPKRDGAAPPAPGQEGARVALRIQDLTYLDKRTIADSKAEVSVSKGHVKCTENGKVIVDSDNDIGLEQMPDYLRPIRNIGNAEVRLTLDSAGRQSQPEGDAGLTELLDAIRAGGAEGFYPIPILAGRTAKVGESWESSYSLPKLGEFRLAKPAVIRPKMTFSKWVAQAGKDLAQIEVATVLETRELKGENDSRLLVEFTQYDRRGAGTFLLDPATGRFVEGALETTSKYHIDGEREGQTVGLDVAGKTRFTFAALPEK